MTADILVEAASIDIEIPEAPEVKMNPEIKARWIEALRSGEYPQCRGSLKTQDGYCCLGVLTDLYLKETGGEWVPGGSNSEDPSYWGIQTNLDGFLRTQNLVLTPEVAAWSGLTAGPDGALNKDVEVKRRQDDGYEWDMDVSTLTMLNDRAEFTFSQIADVVEEQF